MTQQFLLGIDQGSSGSRAVVLDVAGQVRGYGYHPLRRLHPRPDWSEQDPADLTASVSGAITAALGEAGCGPADILACGIAGQRNTDFVWSAETGQPLANAISWQDLRTQSLVAELENWPLAGERRYRLGYFPGSWSSALHLAWRMRHQPAVIEAAQRGDLRIGFSANWMLESLGQPSGHQLDYGLVQQMGLFDFRAERYWAEWLTRLNIPQAALPTPVPTLHDYGSLTLTGPQGETAQVPVLAVIGNEQAALFGHHCFEPGQAECSHGTASFVDVVVGQTAPAQDKLNVYYAWSFPQADGVCHTYCIEADTTVSGAALAWMKDRVGLFADYHAIDALAGSVGDSGGVVFVPAFTGLNVPHHDAWARGSLLGLTLGSGKAHIVRAFLESLGFQIREILETIEAETGLQVRQISTGGGIAASDVACQLQADLTGLPTIRPAFTELAARAVALLAGLGAGVWASPSELPPLPGQPRIFEPQLSASQREAAYARWQAGVATSRYFARQVGR